MTNRITIAGKERAVRIPRPKDIFESEREAKKLTEDARAVNLFSTLNLTRKVVTPPLTDLEFDNLSLKDIREILMLSLPKSEEALQPLKIYDDWTVIDIKETFHFLGSE
ncbi:MAG: hypothetical protein V1854_05480 [Methanobacteriota archaeon]